MSRAAIFFFTDSGAELAGKIASGLGDQYQVEICPKSGLKAQVGRLFSQVDAFIFVGACGIAVRAVAPYLVSKATDPAVVVADEKGEYVISLLSGHIGGANDLARRVAGITGGQAVITTATDVNGRFSADAWAARHGARIGSMAAAKRFSAEILKRDLPLYTDFPVKGALPPGLFLADSGPVGCAIASHAAAPFEDTLFLVPPVLHVGIGCRRGAGESQIRGAVQSVLAQAGLSPLAVRGAASIDVKRDEEGLLAFCRAEDIPASFYSAEELLAVPGEYTGSEFVKQTVGVDNVCERAAMRSAGDGATLLVKKTALDGVTVAVAQEKWSVSFE